MIVFQTVYLVFFVTTLWRLVTKKVFRVWVVTMWILLWTTGAVLVLFPQVSFFLAHIFGIGRGSDLVIYVSIILIIYLLYRIYVKMEKISKRMDLVVRKMSRPVSN